MLILIYFHVWQLFNHTYSPWVITLTVSYKCFTILLLIIIVNSNCSSNFFSNCESYQTIDNLSINYGRLVAILYAIQFNCSYYCKRELYGL